MSKKNFPKNPTRPALTVIDGSGFVYRAFHALPPLTTPDGIAVGAVTGFANMVLRWQEAHQPSHGVIVFDHGRSIFRQEIYPEYKAHRPPTPPELSQQFPYIKQFCTAMGITILEIPGVEADDIIASIADHMVEQGWSVDVVTSDKDLFQISSPHISMHDPIKQRSLDCNEVQTLWGVRPDQIPHVQALAGDSADGIPGIPGIGIKTATAWIQQFESITGLINGVEQLKSIKKRELIENYRHQIPLYYQLALLQRTFWNEAWNPTRWTWNQDVDQIALHNFLESLHLKTLAERLKRRGILHAPPCPPTLPPLSSETLSGLLPFAMSVATEIEEIEDLPLKCVEKNKQKNTKKHADHDTESPGAFPIDISVPSDRASEKITRTPTTCQKTVEVPDEGYPLSYAQSDQPILSSILEAGIVALVFEYINDEINTPMDDGSHKEHSKEYEYEYNNSNQHNIPKEFLLSHKKVWENTAENFSDATKSEKSLQFTVTASWGKEWWAFLNPQEVYQIFQDDSCIKIVHDAKKWIHTLALLIDQPFSQPQSHTNSLIKASDSLIPLYEHDLTQSKDAFLQPTSTPTHAHKSTDPLLGPIDDLMLLSYILNGSSVKHDLISIFTRMGWAQEICSSWSSEQYAHAMLYVWEKNLQELREKQMMGVYYTLDRPLIAILAKMEHHGIDIDALGLKHLEKAWGEEILQISQEVMHQTGQVFNLASPKQLGKVLFEDLGWPHSKKGKSGAYHTDNDVLTRLATQGYTLASLIMQWRQLSKLVNTYARGLREHINPISKRIHTTYSMISTLTGRLSSLEPNLQNIPIRTTQGRLLRQQFRAPEGYGFLSLDYSQIELRLLAHMGPIPSLQKAFAENADIHQQTAARLFGCMPEDVTADMRRTAKGINFGILYGISAFGLAEHLGIDRVLAKTMIQQYFATYPEIADYLERVKKQARTYGYVTTLWGRRCFIPEARNAHGGKRAAAERQAINAPLQGTSADIIKRAMIEADSWISACSYDVALVLQIHDELVFQVRCDHLDAVRNALIPRMEEVAPLSVPLVVTSSFGVALDSDFS